MNSQIILKFNSLKPLEKIIVVFALLIVSLIIFNFATYFFFVIVGVIVVFSLVNQNREELRLKQEIETKYRKSLEELRRNPLDADIYMMALSLGRKHYGILIEGSLSTVDQPIINDLMPIFKSEYERSLDILRNSPKDSILRRRALETARIYYSTIRGGANTIYDEQAINNDLSTIYGSDIDKMS